MGSVRPGAETCVVQISSPEGLKTFCTKYPALRVVRTVPRMLGARCRGLTDACVQITGWIDQGLNEKAYIVPGLGDFGERRCEAAACLCASRSACTDEAGCSVRYCE